MNTFFAFFVLICVLVFVHEYGHFWAARRCGVKVFRFSVGFGPVLWRKLDKHGTEFAFSLIPLGGYVQMADKNSENVPFEQTLQHKTVGQRAFIVAAGPVVNFVLALLLYWAVFIYGVSTVKPVVDSVQAESIAAKSGLPAGFEIRQVADLDTQDWESVLQALASSIGDKQVAVSGVKIGQKDTQTYYLDLSDWQLLPEKNPFTELGINPVRSRVSDVIRSVVAGSPAELAGIRAGDRIERINGVAFDWAFLVNEVGRGDVVHFELLRHNEKINVAVQPLKAENGERFIIGIQPAHQPLPEEYRGEVKYDILTAFLKSAEKVADLTQTIVRFVVKLISGNISMDNLGGPISIAKGAGASADEGFVSFLSFMALISVNLGVMNLFPLLPLDGGRLLCLGYEAICRRPLPAKVESVFQTVGMALVLLLMLNAVSNDVIHLLFK